MSLDAYLSVAQGADKAIRGAVNAVPVDRAGGGWACAAAYLRGVYQGWQASALMLVDWDEPVFVSDRQRFESIVSEALS